MQQLVIYILCCAIVFRAIFAHSTDREIYSDKFSDSEFDTDGEEYEDNVFNWPNDKPVLSNGETLGVKFLDFYNGVSNRVYENIADSLKTRFTQLFFETLGSFNLSQQCYNSTLRVLKGIYERQLWAIKFLDATAKLPNGVAEGVMSSLGDYDECLDIMSPKTTIENENQLYGRYCLAEPVIDLEEIVSSKNSSVINKILSPENLKKWEFQFNINTIRLVMASNATRFAPFRLGLCVPSDCTANDIEMVLNNVFQPLIRVPIRVGPKCDSKADETVINAYQKFAIIFFSVLTNLVFISSLAEIYLNKQSKSDNNNKHITKSMHRSKLRKVLISFSILTNTKSLFRKPHRRLETVDTFFLLFIFWIFWSRAYIAPLTLNMLGLKRVFNSIVLQIITSEKYFWIRTPFPMSILFLFGGIFISRDFFGRKIDKRIFPLLLLYPKFLLEKWLRFLVRIIGPIMLALVASSIGDGPYWHLGEHFFLKTQLWPNIFFYNNYAKTIEKSINHPLIFLSIIFQLQCIAPLFMIPILFYRRFGAIFNVIVVIVWGFVVVSPRIMFGTKIAPFEVNDMQSVEEIRYSLRRYMIYTIQYVAELCLGILTGYAIINKRIIHSYFRGKKFLKYLIIILSLLSCITAILWGDSFKNLNIKPNLVNLLLWLSFGKIMFASGMACICYALCANNKGFLSRISTCYMIRFLNRLSIGILLICADVTYFRLFNNRDNYVITTSYVIQSVYINFPITVMLAYIIYILFECPVINLYNVIRNSTEFKENAKNISLENNRTDTNLTTILELEKLNNKD